MLCQRHVWAGRAYGSSNQTSLQRLTKMIAQGVADAVNVDAFFGAIPVDAARSNFTWIPEFFPNNWFRTAAAYTFKEVIQDVLGTYTAHPDMLVFGGNAGSVDNFVPLGISAPTDVNGFGCFLCEC